MSNQNQSDKYGPKSFSKGKLSVSHEGESEWDDNKKKNYSYRDLGIYDQTGGKLRAHLVRPRKSPDGEIQKHYHKVDFHMAYVIQGWSLTHFEGVGEVRMDVGSCMYQEPELAHWLIDCSDDYTVLEVYVPGDPETIELDA